MADLSIAALIKGTAAAFGKAGIESPELEARLLLQHVLGLDHAGLILAWRQQPDRALQERFAELAGRRLDREPLAYVTGEREFWSLPFAVSRNVLIPRPETEWLLEQALNRVRGGGIQHALDLGCGSGVIAVVLALELGCRVTAVDCSQAALQQTAVNAGRHGVADRLGLLCGDFFTALPAGVRYDLLVSNPPYIAAAEIQELEPEVRRYEPHLALDGGRDGLDAIACISRQAGEVLLPGSWVFLEIGANQAEAAQHLFETAPHHYEELRVLLDLAGRPRVLTARLAT